jgi:hypothetical protein
MRTRYSMARLLSVVFGAAGLVVASSSSASAQTYTVAIIDPSAGGWESVWTTFLPVNGTVTPTQGIMAPASVVATITDPTGAFTWSGSGAAGEPIPGSSPPQWTFDIGVMIGMTGFPWPGTYTITVQCMDGDGNPLPSGRSIYIIVS